jgi:hypothetical protein
LTIKLARTEMNEYGAVSQRQFVAPHRGGYNSFLPRRNEREFQLRKRTGMMM